MGLFKDYVSQTRKPEGFLGKMMHLRQPDLVRLNPIITRANRG